MFKEIFKSLFLQNFKQYSEESQFCVIHFFFPPKHEAMKVQRESRSGQTSQSHRETVVHNFPKWGRLLWKAKTEVV